MTIEVPAIARDLFPRLCRGDNLILSRNGPEEDVRFFERLETEEEACRDYFAAIGLVLQKGDNCYYFTFGEEPQMNLEGKLEKMVRLVRLLDYLSSHLENFGEGLVFSAAVLNARSNGDARSERFLQDEGSGASNSERIESLLQRLVRQGYLSEINEARKEYRVLSAINYLFEFADRIRIHDDLEQSDPTGVPNAQS